MLKITIKMCLRHNRYCIMYKRNLTKYSIIGEKMNLIKEIEKLLMDAVDKAGYKENLSVSFSAQKGICDLQCNGCFALSKKYGKNPFDIASDIISNLQGNENFVFEVAKPAFINIKISDKAFAKFANFILEDERGGLEKNEVSQKVLLDYGGANVAKALHIGHLRPAIIGESLKRLYRLLGDEVISDVHLGDWGLQMGLTELQLFEEGKLDYYFGKGGEKRKLTIEDLNEAYPAANKRKGQEEDFKRKAEEWTLKIQRKEEPYYEVYKDIRQLSVKEISTNYSRLGATFDLWKGESDASDYCKEAVDFIKSKGLAYESEGALVVDVAEEGENVPAPVKEDGVQRYLNPMPPCLIQKSNGADLYATTDIATILMRNKQYKLDRIEYVTDGRQKMHFTQVFRVCKKSGISPEGQELVHIINGTMNGADGKPFKTRSGDTIKLEDIIAMLRDKAKEKLKSNGAEADDETALMIGVAAMKFGDLSNTVSKDYVFDIDKFMSFEGKTGPYLQYMVVRINSILSKLEGREGGEISIYCEEEREILRNIIKLNSAFGICYKDRSLNALCSALYDLASAFSGFYNNHNVLGQKDENRQNSQISLLKIVRKKMLQALDILAVEVPKKM